jgi:hypothetical protein
MPSNIVILARLGWLTRRRFIVDSTVRLDIDGEADNGSGAKRSAETTVGTWPVHTVFATA